MPSLSSVTRHVSLLDRQSTAVSVWLTALAVGSLVAWAFATAGTQVDDWDYLFITGSLTTIAGLWLARGQAERFEAMFERLENRGALAADPTLLAEVATMLRERTRRWSLRAGLALAGGIAGAWIAINLTRGQDVRLLDEIGGPIVGALGGYIVGRVLGRMVSYGMLGAFLSRHHVTFHATPGHPDGAAGLKPLGDYYLYQALLIAVPAVFLLGWSLVFLLPAWDARYDGWRETYLALLALAIALEIAAFVAPMWHAHVAMKHKKRAELITADTTLAPQIAQVRELLESELSVDERAAAQAQLDYLAARHDAIETMPTWPIDSALRRRVSIGNAALVLGLVGQVAALAGWS